MKDRLILAILIVFSWIILVIFQKYLPFDCAVFILIGFMSAYGLLLHISQVHRKRKIMKLIKKGVYQEHLSQSQDYEPKVSIIIPAHNEENVINDTIENIFELDYKNFDVLVVDDRSTDNTPNIIKNLSRKYPKVRYYIRNANAIPGKSAVLNEAFTMTSGEIICVFDADARIKPDFLSKIIPYLADPEVGAVQARKIISNNGNLLTRCQHNEYVLDTHFQAGRDCIKGAVELRGNGQLIKRRALLDVGGWNNETITDDLDLSTRLHIKGWDIRFAENVSVYEEGVLKLIPLLRQRRRWIEGSIRRYLDYFFEVITSRETSLRVSLDMISFISEFVLPVWLISEYLIQGFRLVNGTDINVLYTLTLAPALCLFFISGLFVSIKKYKKLSIKNNFKESIETGIYLVLMWVPIVFYIVFKIIFARRVLDWGKTDHGTDSEIPLLEQRE